jgi:hypothetical protein
LENQQAKKESDRSPRKKLQNISLHGKDIDNAKTPLSTALASIHRNLPVVRQSHQERTNTEGHLTSTINTIDVEKLSWFSVDRIL